MQGGCEADTEVDDVGAHAAALRAVGAREGRGAVLQRGVLLADGGVLQRDVHHLLVAPDQEARLPVDVQDRQRLVALERIESATQHTLYIIHYTSVVKTFCLNLFIVLHISLTAKGVRKAPYTNVHLKKNSKTLYSTHTIVYRVDH